MNIQTENFHSSYNEEWISKVKLVEIEIWNN